MLRFFYIGLGGALGALLRYGISGLAHRFYNSGFPIGTLSVNVIGSLLIGFLWGVFESVTVSQNIRLFIFMGIIGSFTTFSTFSLECFHLLRDGEHGLFFINVFLNFLLCIILVFIGYFTSRYMLDLIR